MRSHLRVCCLALVAIALLQLIAAQSETMSAHPFAHRASLGRALHRKALLNQKTRVGSSGYSYKTMWFTQFVDHFNFKNSMATFQQRYLINTDSWQAPTAANNYSAGPLFFYTGNEGDVVEFAENTGFMWEIAPRFNAMIVFAEHRYYGETMPLGNMSFANPDNLQYLTANQALADFAVLINALKAQYLPPQSQGLMPVIAFGGSYGGMLTAWIREKYPHIVIGGIAASAPIWQFEGLVSAESYSSICSRTFAYYGSACSDGIAKSWGILNNWASTPLGLAKINSIFAPCQQFASAADVTNQLFPFLGNALSTLPMGNYPYPTTFLGPMPGWPVQVACSFFASGQSDLDNIIALKNAINVYYNYTGEAGTCFQMASSGPSSLADAGGWAYQSCNEMVMPIGQDGIHDIFYPAVWNLTATIANCQAIYGITPRPYWIPTQFGSWDLARSAVTNIVFSNGDMDPWSGGGVLTNLSDSLVAIKIHLGAHHLDLRSSNPADPESVVYARQIHVAYIQKWINEYYSLSSRPIPMPSPCPGCPECPHCSGEKLSTTKVVVIACFATAAALGMATGCFWYFWNDVKHKRQQQWQETIAAHDHAHGDVQTTSDQRYAELDG